MVKLLVILLFFAKRVGGTQQPSQDGWPYSPYGLFWPIIPPECGSFCWVQQNDKVSETKNRTDGAGTACDCCTSRISNPIL